MFSFGIFGTAMFAEPAVAEIEKVIGLVQSSGGRRVAFGAGLIRQTGTVRSYCLRIVPRLTSGP